MRRAGSPVDPGDLGGDADCFVFAGFEHAAPDLLSERRWMLRDGSAGRSDPWCPRRALQTLRQFAVSTICGGRPVLVGSC